MLTFHQSVPFCPKIVLAGVMQFPFKYRGNAGADILDVHDAKSGWYMLQSWSECANKPVGISGVIVCFELTSTRKLVVTFGTLGKVFLSVYWDGTWEQDNKQII